MCNAVTSTIRYLSPHVSILQHLLPIRTVLDIARNIGRARTSLLVRADLSHPLRLAMPSSGEYITSGNPSTGACESISEELIQPVCKLVVGHMRHHIEVALDAADMTLELKTELGSVRTSEVSEYT